MAELRDRITNPSINFPQSADEAFQAILHSVRRAMINGTALSGIGVLNRVYVTDAGLGTTRTQQQADWLMEQQELLRSSMEDFLDRLDIESRRY